MNHDAAALRELVEAVSSGQEIRTWLASSAEAYPPLLLLAACGSAELDVDRRLELAEFLFVGNRIPRTASASNPCEVDDSFAEMWLDLILADETPPDLRSALGPLMEDSMSPGLMDHLLDEGTKWFADNLATRRVSDSTLRQLLGCERFVSDGVLLSAATPSSLLQQIWDETDEDSMGWGVPTLMLRNPNITPELADRMIDWMVRNELGEELDQVAADSGANAETLAKLADVALREDLPNVVEELLDNPSLSDELREQLE